MKKLLLATGLLFMLHTYLQATDSLRLPLVITIYNNATLLPGAAEWGIWGQPVHPGASVGTEFIYRQKQHHSWLQTVNLAYHYHQYATHSLQLYSEGVYRRHFPHSIDAEAKLGVGYIHSIPDAQIFELDANGVYRSKSNWGKPQAMGSVALGIGYTFKGQFPLRTYINYRFYIQTPFVNKYVPVLPNTALHLGLAMPLIPK